MLRMTSIIYQDRPIQQKVPQGLGVNYEQVGIFDLIHGFFLGLLYSSSPVTTVHQNWLLGELLCSAILPDTIYHWEHHDVFSRCFCFLIVQYIIMYFTVKPFSMMNNFGISSLSVCFFI